MRRLRLKRISTRDLLAIAVPALLLLVAAFWVAYQYIRPAPPDRIVISTGAESGAYHAFAKRYQEILARDGITLELRTSSGALENFRRLADDESEVEIGFVQGGTADSEDAPDLRSLGSVSYEPVWVFYRGVERVDRLGQLSGKRIAIGAEGSGNRKLALELLAANAASAAPTRLLPLGGIDAAEALVAGAADAVIVVAAPEAGVVKALLYAKGVRLMNFDRAAAYTRRFQFLYPVMLPQGTIDLIRDIPPADTHLFAPTANLLIKDTLHPALVDLMMQAISEVHGGRGVFHNAHEFPSAKDPEFPLSPEARRYYQSGAPFLQRYLPFWAATLADRIMVMLIPVIALLIPLLRAAPALYAWRVRSRLYRLYGELKFLEHDIRENLGPHQYDDYMARLDAIDQAADTRPIPLAFADQQYTLRQHIDFVRSALEKLRPKA
jgi:TRAP-type uncharacterized transport system substrate-binding protein